VRAKAVTLTLVFFFILKLIIALPIHNLNFVVINLLSRQSWFDNPSISCTKMKMRAESESYKESESECGE
jgi:hypothetical protein